MCDQANWSTCSAVSSYVLEEFPNKRSVRNIWFTDEKTFTVAAQVISQSDRAYSLETKKRQVPARRLVRECEHFSRDIMVCIEWGTNLVCVRWTMCQSRPWILLWTCSQTRLAAYRSFKQHVIVITGLYSSLCENWPQLSSSSWQ